MSDSLGVYIDEGEGECGVWGVNGRYFYLFVHRNLHAFFFRSHR